MSSGCIVCDKQTRHRCSRCHRVYYCSQDHQRTDWGRHKALCQRPPEQKVADADIHPPVSGLCLTAALPSEILQSVFSHLDVTSLSRSCLVCKTWKPFGEDEQVWELRCASLWKQRLNMPHERWRLLPVTSSFGEPAEGEAEVDYWSLWMPPSRNVQGDIATVEPARDRLQTVGHTMTWKQTYWQAVLDAGRTRRTDQELTYFTWSIVFRGLDEPTSCSFLPDRRFTDINFDLNSGCYWGIRRNMLRVSRFEHVVSRTADWGWRVGSDYVEMKTQLNGWQESAVARVLRTSRAHAHHRRVEEEGEEEEWLDAQNVEGQS